MTLTVEDGTGVATADTYVSQADADTFHAANGAPAVWTAATSDEKDAALREATRYLDGAYMHRYVGQKYTKEQSLHWPRTGAYDWHGWDIAVTAIPQQLKDACAMLALRAKSASLLGDLEDGAGAIKKTLVKVITNFP